MQFLISYRIYRKPWTFPILVAISCLFVLSANPRDCSAQPPETQWNDFASAFSHVATRDKVTIVTEDAPYRDKLTEEQVRKLLTELQTDKPSERYQALANAYDYDCTQEGNMLILRKRYSHIEDLPYVPYEEARHALDRMERSLASLNPPGPESGLPNSAFSQWLGSLTEEQITNLKTKVPMETLSPEQRQLLLTVCAKDYMKPFATLSRINTWYIKQLREPETVFRWVQVIPDTPKILILDGPLGFHGGRVQKGLSHGFVAQSGGMSELQNPLYRTRKRRSMGIISSYFILDWDAAQTKMWQDALTDLEDRTAPPPDALPPPVSSSRLTLSRVIDRLNARSGGQESYQLDPALNHKPVCVFGLENAAPRAIFERLTTLYDLEISRPEDRVMRIVPPRLTRVRGYSDVFPTLRRHFPSPYLRYYQAQLQARIEFTQKPENLPEPARQNSQFKRAPTFFINHVLAYRATDYLKVAIYDIAVRRLRVEVEPRIKAAPNEILKFADAGVEVQRLLTLLCLLETFSTLNETVVPLSLMGGPVESDFGVWAGQFDSLMIEVSVAPNRSGANLEIWDTTGKHLLYRKGQGAIGADYKPKPEAGTPKPQN